MKHPHAEFEAPGAAPSRARASEIDELDQPDASPTLPSATLATRAAAGVPGAALAIDTGEI